MASRVEQERKQSQTQKIHFEVQAQISTSPPLPREGFHYPLRIFPLKSFHKGTTMVDTKLKCTAPTLNPL